MVFCKDDRHILVHGGSLRVSNPSFGSAGCLRVLQIVQHDESITELNFTGGCNISKGDELAEIIQSCHNLKRLILEWNNLGLARTGIMSLTSSIALSSTLKEVDLRSNRIGPSFATALANSLRSSRSLQCLDLRWNAIGPSGAAAFLNLLQKNHSIAAIQLAGNGIPQSLLTDIDKQMEQNYAQKMGQPPTRLHFHVKHIMEEEITKNNASKQGIEAIHMGRLSALEAEIDALNVHVESLKKEKDDLRLQALASENQLKAVQLELTEEALLRKYIDKEAAELKEQLLRAKQEVACYEEKLLHDAKLAADNMAAQNAALAEAQKREKLCQDLHMAAVQECNSLKEQIFRIREEHSSQLLAMEEKSKAGLVIIKRLESAMTATEAAHSQDIDNLNNHMGAQVKAIQAERDEALKEVEKAKCTLSTLETQFANREKNMQQDKEAIQQILNARLGAVKSEVESLQSELDSMRREVSKIKKKHAMEIEELETRGAQHKAMLHRCELTKSELEERIFSLTADKVQLQEKLKLSDDREMLTEKRMELERLRYTEASSAQSLSQMDEKRRLECQLASTRKVVESTQRQLEEVEAEAERRRIEAERRVSGVETAFIDWTRQQFASLRAVPPPAIV